MENAYALLAQFKRDARKADLKPEYIEKVIKEATSGDYDHLVEVLDAENI